MTRKGEREEFWVSKGGAYGCRIIRGQRSGGKSSMEVGTGMSVTAQ